MAGSSFFDFVLGYESDKKQGIKSSGAKRFFSRSYSGSVTGGGGAVLKRTVGIGNKVTRIFSFTQSNAYGAGLLGYGITTFLAYFLIYYFEIPVENGSYSAVMGAVAVILSIPLLCSRKPIGQAVQSVRALDFVLFEFFCIKRPHFSEKTAPIPIPVVAVFGFILGFLGFFVPSWTVAVSIGAAIVVFVAFLSPECSFLVSLMAWPYLEIIPFSDIPFAVLVLLTVISFIRKVACGKRVIFFEQYDFLIILLVVIFLISGIFMAGTASFIRAVVLLFMSFGYLLASNLIANRRIADCALNAVVIASIPASVYSVYLFVSQLIGGTFSLAEVSIYSTFTSELECAIFLICSILFCLALTRHASGRAGVVYSSVAVLNAFALVLTGQIMAVIALIIGIFGYFALKMGRVALPIVFMLGVIPYLYFARPADVAAYLAENISGAENPDKLFELWRAALIVLRENLIFGAGMGEESFSSEMLGQGAEGYTNAQNIFLELGLEAGIFAVLVFVLILLVRIRHRSVYHRYLGQADLDGTLAYVGAAVLSMVCLGATEYIWAEGASLYLFLCVFGMGSAILRFAKKEVDDRILYYEDARDEEYSAIDIHLR